MRIVEEYQSFIHTRFVTDGEAISEPDQQLLERELATVLRGRGIVVAAQVEPDFDSGCVRVVLPCRPGDADLEVIRAKLVGLLRPLPIRPAPTVAARVPSQGPYR